MSKANLKSNIAEQIAAAQQEDQAVEASEAVKAEDSASDSASDNAVEDTSELNADDAAVALLPKELQDAVKSGALSLADVEAMNITKATVPEGRATRQSDYLWDKVPAGYSFFVSKTASGKVPNVSTFYTLTSNRNERGLAQFKAKSETHNGVRGVRIYRLEDLTPEEHAEKYDSSPFKKKLAK